MFKNIKRLVFWFITVTCIGGIAFAIIDVSSYISQHGLKSICKNPTIERIWSGYQNTRSPKIGDTKDACIEVIFTKDGWIPVEGK